MGVRAWLRAAAVGVAMSLGLASGGASAHPALIVEVSVKPMDRRALSVALHKPLQGLLQRQAVSGEISSFQVFLNRYPDKGVWDEMMILTFKDDAAFALWT